jgi:ketosteroid isomerase-like protein
MRRVLLLVLLLVVGAPAMAASRHGKDVRELTALVKGMHSAVMRGDVAYLDRALAAEHVNIYYHGVVTTKAEFLAHVRAGKTKAAAARVDDLHVRVYGDTAVVHYRLLGKARVAGRETEGAFRTLRVFVRRNGRWQCVASQYTMVQA